MPHYGPGVDSVSERNQYHGYFLGGKGGWCKGLTTLPPSCADRLEILFLDGSEIVSYRVNVRVGSHWIYYSGQE
jgi:hypothetical protein